MNLHREIRSTGKTTSFFVLSSNVECHQSSNGMFSVGVYAKPYENDSLYMSTPNTDAVWIHGNEKANVASDCIRLHSSWQDASDDIGSILFGFGDIKKGEIHKAEFISSHGIVLRPYLSVKVLSIDKQKSLMTIHLHGTKAFEIDTGYSEYHIQFEF